MAQLFTSTQLAAAALPVVRAVLPLAAAALLLAAAVLPLVAAEILAKPSLAAHFLRPGNLLR